MSSESYHEPVEVLTEETRDIHRAIESLMEELEAVDWYQQRVDATKDEDLKAILGHNRDEEIEHAMMVLEWLRRRMPKLDEHAKTYLFTTGKITEIEADEKEGGASGGGDHAPIPKSGLGIGSLKASATRSETGGRK